MVLKREDDLLVQIQIYSITGPGKKAYYRYTVGALGNECHLPPLMYGQKRSLIEVSDFMRPKETENWISRMAVSYHPLDEDSTSVAYDVENVKQPRLVGGCRNRKDRIAVDKFLVGLR